MSEWWSGLPVFEKVFWYFALPFTFMFVIRLAASLIGVGAADDDADLSDAPDFDSDGDGDGEADGGDGSSSFLAGFRLFTLQNFIIFFTGFGWGGIFSVHAGFSQLVSIIVALIIGMLLMVAVASMYYLITRLTESGNINLVNAVNSVGRVYLPIPGHRAGTGQIQITVQGSFREVEAMTDGDTLPTGTPVKVTGVLNQELVMVEKNS